MFGERHEGACVVSREVVSGMDPIPAHEERAPGISALRASGFQKVNKTVLPITKWCIWSEIGVINPCEPC